MGPLPARGGHERPRPAAPLLPTKGVTDMLLLGLVLLGATGAFTGLLISENHSGGPDYAVTMFGNDLGTVDTLGAFLAGIALTLVFCLALAMTASGSARQRRRNAELRAMRRERREYARTADAGGAASATRTADTAGTPEPTGTPGTTGTEPAAGTEPGTTTTTTTRHRRTHLFGH